MLIVFSHLNWTYLFFFLLLKLNFRIDKMFNTMTKDEQDYMLTIEH